MIESKDVLIEEFMRLAAQFQQSQDLITGIDLDDAIVKLKRYVLSQERNEALARQLHDMGGLVRSQNMEEYAVLFEQIKKRL